MRASGSCKSARLKVFSSHTVSRGACANAISSRAWSADIPPTALVPISLRAHDPRGQLGCVP